MLDMNFDDVADEYTPVEPGVYEFVVSEVPSIEPTSKGDSTKMVVKMKITSEGEYKDRSVADHISMKMKTQIKRFLISIGKGTWLSLIHISEPTRRTPI